MASLVRVLSTPSQRTQNGEFITAGRRLAPTYRAQAATPHISVDLLDREGTTKAFSSLYKVTDLVFAASSPKWGR